jgi:heme/copper-type cytochrome/quinol oxidase subunit 2
MKTHGQIALILLIFAYTAFAQSQPATAKNSGDAGFSPSCAEAQNSIFFASLRKTGWLTMSAVALLAGFAVVSFSFMISRLFSQSPLEAWARNEAYQIVATALIVFLLLVLSNLEFRVLESFGFKPVVYADNPAISSGIEYLQHAWSFTTNNLANSYVAHTSAQIVAASLNRIKDVSLGAAGIVFSGDWTGKKLGSQLRNVFGIVLYPLGFATAVTTAQIWFMCIIDSVAFNLLLPIGVLLRVAPFTRGIGSAMIAIAVGFYLVYPLTLMLDEKIVTFYHGNDPTWWIIKIAGTDIPLGSGGAPIAFGSALMYFASTVLQEFGLGGVITLRVLAGLGGLYGTLSTLLTDFIPNAAFAALILGTFLPFINIVITFVFIRELAKTLGTDVNLNSLLRIL